MKISQERSAYHRLPSLYVGAKPLSADRSRRRMFHIIAWKYLVFTRMQLNIHENFKIFLGEHAPRPPSIGCEPPKKFPSYAPAIHVRGNYGQSLYNMHACWGVL